MMNHLWQSTIFAAVCALLALALRSNSARVRYGVWMAASLKFLVPFSILVQAGMYFGQHTVASSSAPAPQFPVLIAHVSAPFAPVATPVIEPAAAQMSLSHWLPALLWTVWAIGFAVLAGRWWIRWRSVKSALRGARPLELPGGTRAMTSPAFGEPGVFGIWRPVLALPEGITECLTTEQLEAVVAHELCHARRHDNLATALHMGVEALFWFHPLVWWIGARLLEERERTCDEEVLRAGTRPEDYAAGILKICELYLESRLACMAGVSGGNLKKRIEEIMTRRVTAPVSAAKKALLGSAAAAAIAAPVWFGLWNAPAIQAQDLVRPNVKFEVAAIKTCKTGDEGGGRGGKNGGGGGRIRWDPTMLHEECQTVRNLIRDAYLAYPEGKAWTRSTREEPTANARGLENRGCTGCGIGLPPVSLRLFDQDFQGGPGWVNSDRYTIDARSERPEPPEMMRGPMMRALLEERFQLKIHRETKDVPVYELTASGVSKLTPSPEGSCLPFSEMIKLPPRRPNDYHGPKPCGGVWMGDGKSEFPGTTIAGFCRNLSQIFDRDVVDKTGMAGVYNISVDAAYVLLPIDDSAPRDPDMPPPRPPLDHEATSRDFQRALPKIGLRLEPAKGTGVFLVIDHVERPSEN